MRGWASLAWQHHRHGGKIAVSSIVPLPAAVLSCCGGMSLCLGHSVLLPLSERTAKRYLHLCPQTHVTARHMAGTSDVTFSLLYLVRAQDQDLALRSCTRTLGGLKSSQGLPCTALSSQTVRLTSRYPIWTQNGLLVSEHSLRFDRASHFKRLLQPLSGNNMSDAPPYGHAQPDALAFLDQPIGAFGTLATTVPLPYLATDTSVDSSAQQLQPPAWVQAPGVEVRLERGNGLHVQSTCHL